MSTLPAASPSARFIAIDWMRALAVLVMIECHSLVFLSKDHDFSAGRQFLNSINGLAAPTFILLAGLMLAFLMGRAVQSLAGRGQRARKSLARIGQVFLASLLLRGLFWPMRELRGWLMVDILSCIGWSLLVVWLVTLLVGSRGWLAGMILAMVGLAVFAIAPITHANTNWGWVGWFISVPPNTTATIFPLVPWSGYALLGGCIGRLTADAKRPGVVMARGCAALALMGLAWACIGPSLSQWYRGRNIFLITNAGERLFMLSLIGLLLIGLARWPGRMPIIANSPPLRLLGFFGRISLSAYVIHLIILFGSPLNRWSYQLHGKVGWWGWVGLMLLLVALTTAACALLGWVIKAVKKGAGGRAGTRAPPLTP